MSRHALRRVSGFCSNGTNCGSGGGAFNAVSASSALT